MSVVDRLTNLIVLYKREARKCVSGRGYFGATVMEVSALEASLQALCFLYHKRIQRTKVYQGKRFRKKRYKVFEFNLYELINIAHEVGWFPSKKFTWAGKRTTLAGFVHEIRKVRNYVHPGQFGRERAKPLKFTKGVYSVVCEVYDTANSWLLHSVESSIAKKIKRT